MKKPMYTGDQINSIIQKIIIGEQQKMNFEKMFPKKALELSSDYNGRLKLEKLYNANAIYEREYNKLKSL